MSNTGIKYYCTELSFNLNMSYVSLFEKNDNISDYASLENTEMFNFVSTYFVLVIWLCMVRLWQFEFLNIRYIQDAALSQTGSKCL